MSSQIIYTTIDSNYPAAGQDNDSQGFRDNFARIKNGLATAQSEITALQTNSIDKTASVSSMSGNTLDSAILRNSGITSLTTLASVSSSTATEIEFSQQQYRRYALSANALFQINYFPINCYSSIYLELSISTSNLVQRTVNFQAGTLNSSLTGQTQNMYYGAGFQNNTYLTILPTTTTLIKISSPDGGVNIFVSVEDIYKKV